MTSPDLLIEYWKPSPEGKLIERLVDDLLAAFQSINLEETHPARCIKLDALRHQADLLSRAEP